MTDLVKLENLNSIVSESAKANVAPQKRKRGRPKGTKKKPAAPEFATDPLGPIPEGERINLDPEPEPQVGADPEVQTPEIPKEMLVLFLKAPFTMARTRTGFDGFNLPDEVAEQCAPLLNQCLDQYLPGMLNSPHAPAFMLCYTLGSVAFMQYQAYEEWKFLKATPVKTETAQTPPPHFGTNGAGFMSSGVA